MKLNLAMIKQSKCWLCVSPMSTSHLNGKLLWNNLQIFFVFSSNNNNQITNIVTCLSSLNLVHFKLDIFRGRRNCQSFISISSPLFYLLQNLHKHSLHMISTNTQSVPWLLPNNTLLSCFHYRNVFQDGRKFSSMASSPFPTRHSWRKCPC